MKTTEESFKLILDGPITVYYKDGIPHLNMDKKDFVTLARLARKTYKLKTKKARNLKRYVKILINDLLLDYVTRKEEETV